MEQQIPPVNCQDAFCHLVKKNVANLHSQTLAKENEFEGLYIAWAIEWDIFQFSSFKLRIFVEQMYCYTHWDYVGLLTFVNLSEMWRETSKPLNIKIAYGIIIESSAGYKRLWTS